MQRSEVNLSSKGYKKKLVLNHMHSLYSDKKSIYVRYTEVMQNTAQLLKIKLHDHHIRTLISKRSK